MFDPYTSLLALGAVLAGAFLTWLISLVRGNVAIVDVIWAPMFLVAATVYFAAADSTSTRATVVLVLVSLWTLRLSGYIAWRSRGEEEDHRYQAIRANNQPGFEWKSLYLVFGLQGVLAWFVSMPLQAAIHGVGDVNWLDLAGIVLWTVGMLFEAGADHQLARFRGERANAGKVLDRGLWRYSRHPNYFGNFCIWWGFYLIAAAAGGWWSILSPIVMSILLLKVSGVVLLEKTIGERRPGYADYARRTNAFFPGPPKSGTPGAGS